MIRLRRRCAFSSVRLFPPTQLGSLRPLGLRFCDQHWIRHDCAVKVLTKHDGSSLSHLNRTSIKVGIPRSHNRLRLR